MNGSRADDGPAPSDSDKLQFPLLLCHYQRRHPVLPGPDAEGRPRDDSAPWLGRGRLRARDTEPLRGTRFSPITALLWARWSSFVETEEPAPRAPSCPICVPARLPTELPTGCAEGVFRNGPRNGFLLFPSRLRDWNSEKPPRALIQFGGTAPPLPVFPTPAIMLCVRWLRPHARRPSARLSIARAVTKADGPSKRSSVTPPEGSAPEGYSSAERRISALYRPLGEPPWQPCAASAGPRARAMSPAAVLARQIRPFRVWIHHKVVRTLFGFRASAEWEATWAPEELRAGLRRRGGRAAANCAPATSPKPGLNLVQHPLVARVSRPAGTQLGRPRPDPCARLHPRRALRRDGLGRSSCPRLPELFLAPPLVARLVTKCRSRVPAPPESAEATSRRCDGRAARARG